MVPSAEALIALEISTDTAAFVTVGKPETHDFDAAHLIRSHKANPLRIGQAPDNVKLLPLFFNHVKRHVHSVNGKEALPEFGLAHGGIPAFGLTAAAQLATLFQMGNWIAV